MSHQLDFQKIWNDVKTFLSDTEEVRRFAKRRICFRRRLPRRFKEFKAWLASPPLERPADDKWINRGLFKQWHANDPQHRPLDIAIFSAEMFQSDRPVGVVVTDETIQALLLDDARKHIPILQYELNGADQEHYRLSGFKFDRVIVKGGRTLELHDCLIRSLKVEHENSRLVLDGCYVDHLDLKAKALSDLRITDGLIFRIGTGSLTGENQNPFVGRTTVKGLYLPRNIEEIGTRFPDDDRPKVIYEYRNARSFLSAKHDGLSAGVFHAAELALERQDEPSFWNRAFSYVYEISCDFGNSVARPIKWLVALLVFIGLIVWWFNAVQTVGDVTGWQEYLKGDCANRQALRAFIYPLQTVFNPLGVFSAKPLLIAKLPAISFVLTTLGLLGTLCIAFVLVALRRRFRLE